MGEVLTIDRIRGPLQTRKTLHLGKSGLRPFRARNWGALGAAIGLALGHVIDIWLKK